MTAPWSAGSETPREAADEAVAVPADQAVAVPADQAVAVPADQAVDELVVLDQLEADLAAVERAVESLEQVSTEGVVGDAAARRIEAAVSAERFGASDLVGDGLVDQ